MKLSIDQALTAMESLCSEIEGKCGIDKKARNWAKIAFRSMAAICFVYIMLDSVGWAHTIEYWLGMRPLAIAQCIDAPAKYHQARNY